MATHLINIGDKVGIFEALNQSKEGLTVPEIASKLGLHEPYLKTWCQTMYHFEVLDCDESIEGSGFNRFWMRSSETRPASRIT